MDRQPALVTLGSHLDERGLLVHPYPLQGVPFSVLRVFFVTGAPQGTSRGAHAHLRCHQFLICASGSISVSFDAGHGSQEVILDNPQVGLHIPPLIWSSQVYLNPQTVLIVLCSELYDPAEYIYDHNEFVELIRKRELS
jgi:dTDP-4-dehydrorhamnose 3,5-epimerase-like enzyme